MLKYIMIVWMLLATACSTKTLPELGYNLLFSSNIRDDCLTTYEKNNFLYIVSSEKLTDHNYRPIKQKLGFRKYHVSIYNPEYGLFGTFVLPTDVVGVCNSINFEKADIRVSNLHLVYAKAFRNAFDNAKKDPNLLQELMTAGSPYFVRNGKVDNEKSTIRVDNLRIGAGSTDFDDFILEFKNLEPRKTRMLIDETISKVRYREEKANRDKLAREKEDAQADLLAKQAQERWNERLNKNINIGDEVCTYHSNIFGNIDSISGDRVKVYVIGKALTYQGVFFSGKEVQFPIDAIEGYRWFNRNELAHCRFTK